MGAELDDAASAGRFDGADSDVGSGVSALSSSWFSANRTLFKKSGKEDPENHTRWNHKC